MESKHNKAGVSTTRRVVRGCSRRQVPTLSQVQPDGIANVRLTCSSSVQGEFNEII